MATFAKIRAARYVIAPKVSREASDLIKRLLSPNPARRLGTLAGGADDVIKHAVCHKIDKARLLRRDYTPPWVPSCKDPTDMNNFKVLPVAATHAAKAKKYDVHIERAGGKYDELWQTEFGKAEEEAVPVA